MLRRTAIAFFGATALAIGATALVSGSEAAAARTSDPSPASLLVYETKRPALDVSVTRKGDRVVRASVGRLFRGRFKGDKVIGVFRESHFEVGGSTEGFPPTCGNTRPRGRYQHFVAWLVERNHHKGPHPPLRRAS